VTNSMLFDLKYCYYCCCCCYYDRFSGFYLADLLLQVMLDLQWSTFWGLLQQDFTVQMSSFLLPIQQSQSTKQNLNLNHALPEYFCGCDFFIGLKVDDFDKESHGEMVIEFLQMKHKCVIIIQESAAVARYLLHLVSCSHLHTAVFIWYHCI